jgi:methyltransferase
VSALGISPAELVIGLVLIQRLCELWYAKANTTRLLEAGGVEHGLDHYPYIMIVHIAWIASLAMLVPEYEPINWYWLGVYLALQLGRAWVLLTLGRRWTTRIITMRGEPLVTHGPYRYVRHPNYIIVAAEIFVLPMVFSQIWIALGFSALNAAVLYERIKVENAALARSNGGSA